MTAHRCCPGCGTELTADGGTRCGCVGPFTAEHVDPMHIRPYVDLPEPVDDGPSEPDLAAFARCGTGETAELPVISAALPPEASRPAASGGGSHRRAKGRAASSVRAGRGGRDARDRRDDERADGPARRRPGTAVLAAAGVVAALGAGLLTTQTLTDGDPGDSRSLSTDDRALTEVPSGGPTEGPSRTGHGKGHDEPSAHPSRTAATAAPRADRDSDEHTHRKAASPHTSSSAAPSRPDSSGDSGGGRNGGRGGYPHHPQQPPTDDSAQPGGGTLRTGDSGTEVVELQRRLKQAGTLPRNAPEDGVYSSAVQQAVAQYQSSHYVSGDNFGEYGPYTRRMLESQTTG